MAKVDFQFDKPFDEFVVNGKEYNVYFDDDSLRSYQDGAKSFYEKALEKETVDVSSLSKDESEAIRSEQMDVAKGFIELFFGEGSFEELYPASGKSILNLMTICEKLLEWLDSKVGGINEKKKQYYIKK